MIRIYFKDGTTEEYSDVNASFENEKFMYFMKDINMNVVTYIPLNSIKFWEDDHSTDKMGRLLDADTRVRK